jgi:hypothetical protein
MIMYIFSYNNFINFNFNLLNYKLYNQKFIKKMKKL